MLSQKTKYALMAMMRLAREYGGGPMLISEIAEREGIPKKFLEQILLELKNEGLLQSKKGKNGGYLLGKDPKAIKFGEVIRAVEGPLAPLPCVSQSAYAKCHDCKDERVCGIRLVMKEVRDTTAKILDGTSLADVIRKVEEIIISEKLALLYYI